MTRAILLLAATGGGSSPANVAGTYTVAATSNTSRGCTGIPGCTSTQAFSGSRPPPG
ncbi:MAG TPA: hypothetical protein VGF94_09985 [Kofleriaceae bacterium]|jgi:hypothetical protein